MGGIGSGTYERKRRKITVGEGLTLDVRCWQREGLLKPGRRFKILWGSPGERMNGLAVQVEAQRVVFAYRCEWSDGSRTRLKYPVALDWMPCPLGGGRYWFQCPNEACGQRVAILHMGDSRFACRHCLNLAYPSQRENVIDRNLRRVRKLRSKLGSNAGSMASCPDKPKGMRWRTYNALVADSNTALLQAMRAVVDKVSG